MQEENISSDEDEAMDVDTINKGLSISILNDVLTKSLVLEGKVHSAEMKAVVGNNYENLYLAFDNFQKILKTTYQQQKDLKSKLLLQTCFLKYLLQSKFHNLLFLFQNLLLNIAFWTIFILFLFQL